MPLIDLHHGSANVNNMDLALLERPPEQSVLGVPAENADRRGFKVIVGIRLRVPAGDERK